MDLVWDRRRNDYNDEGFYWSYCYSCQGRTEHESGSCCACHNRRLANRVRTFTVSDYTVKVYPNGKKYCTCPGFKFRKDCKHVKGIVS